MVYRESIHEAGEQSRSGWMVVSRRALLKSSGAALLPLAAPSIGRASELLQLYIAEIEAAQCASHRRDIGGTGLRLYFE